MPNVKYGECDIVSGTTMTANGDVLRPAQAFLDWAKDLAASKERMDWNLSIVASLVACEIATERVIVAVAKASDQEELVSGLRSEVASLASGEKRYKTFKMHEKGVATLYRDLTQDEIREPKPEWTRFAQAIDHRNDVLHHIGEQKEQSEAQECLEAALAFVGRVQKSGAKAIARFLASPSTPDG